MKRLILILMLAVFGFCIPGYAESQDEAERFAKIYEKEKQEKAQAQENAPPWSFTAKVNLASAYYQEDEQGISSDFNAFYPEVSLSAEKDTEGDVRFMAHASFGMSLREKETWDFEGEEFQDNDLDFSRFDVGLGIGKILYSERDKNLRAIPFVDYRFRYIYFARSNFTIFSTPANVDPVTEKYYLQCLGTGLKIEKKFNDKFGCLATLGFGYFIYNAAQNSAYGTLVGNGGYLGYGNLDFSYSLNDSWKLLCGAFVDYQDLNGKETTDIIWPNNKMTTFGGDLAIKYSF